MAVLAAWHKFAHFPINIPDRGVFETWRLGIQDKAEKVEAWKQDNE
mgnify:CR=1 FL=1|jgi:hypothetical protein